MDLEYYLNYYKDYTREDLVMELARQREAHSKRNNDYKRRNMDKVLAYQKKWKEKNPEKYLAKTLVGRAVRGGKLPKQPCQECGDVKSIAHHTDYAKPLEVIWLCRKHHREIHYGN